MSGTRTETGSPGRSARGSACPSRCVRFSTPSVTSADEPPGATSHSRATSCPVVAVGTTVTTSSGTPRISQRSGERRRVEDEAAAVLARAGRRPSRRGRPRRATWGRPSRARACRRARARAPAPGSSSSAPGASESRRGGRSRGGHSGSPTQRPVRTSGSAPGSTRSGMNARSAGSSSSGSAAQVLVEDGHAALQEADRRARRADVRVHVRPRAEQPAHAIGRRLEHAEDRAAVGVGEAADHLDVTGDRAGVVADGAMLPEGVAALVGDPLVCERPYGVEPLEPARPPALADDRRVGRARGVGEHRGRPRERGGGEDRTACEVDIVGVAIVGRAHADDAAERRRAQRSDLQAVEAAPRLADHAHAAAAPRLCGEPGDHLDPVVELLLQVLALEDPLGIARAPQVDAHAGEPASREVRVHPCVARGGRVVLAVGDVLEDRRNRIGLGVLGEPQSRREPRPVRQRDPDPVDPLDGSEGASGAVGHGVFYHAVGHPRRSSAGTETSLDYSRLS